MHRPPRYRRKSWRKPKTPQPVHLSRRERFLFAAAGIAMFVGGVLFIHFSGVRHGRIDREDALEQMRIKYALTDIQLSKIREIEKKYHGSGSVFFKPVRSLEEQQAHLIAISEEMNPEAAARFLSSKQESKANSGKRH